MSSRGTGIRNYMMERKDPRNFDYGKGVSRDFNVLFNGGIFAAGGPVISNESAKQIYIDILRNTSASGGPDFTNINMNYVGNSESTIPDYAGDLRSEKASSHWVPNTTSPDASGQRITAVEDPRYTDKAGSAPFTGLGSSLSPAAGAQEIATKDRTIGELLKGSRPKV